MKTKTLSLIFFALLGLVAGCAPSPPPEPPKPAPAPAPSAPVDKATTAKALYESGGCVACHGPDGKGKIQGAPNFTSISWQSKVQDESIIKALKNGKGEKMPAFKGGQGTDEEIDLLIYYIRYLGTVALENGTVKTPAPAATTETAPARPKNKADTVFPKEPPAKD